MTEDVTSDESFAVKDGIVVLSNGVRVVNTSPHPFVFDDGTSVPACGVTLNAAFVEGETPAVPGFSGVVFVTTAKQSTAEGLSFLENVPEGVLVLGSAIAAEAYGFPVVMAVPTAETAGRGTPPADKRMRSDRFTRFS